MATSLIGNFSSDLRARIAVWQSTQRLRTLNQQVAAHAHPQPDQAPAVIFNASSRLTGLSQNAGFTLLAAWSLRLAGVPVVHFVCQAGMSHCVLGTNRQDYHKFPPCAACIAQSNRLYSEAQVRSFNFRRDLGLAAELDQLDIQQLSAFETSAPLAGAQASMPLGAMVLPSIRWALRRHTLPDDEPTRYLLGEYILSAYNVAREFGALLERVRPQVTLIFNGIMYPEAAARWVSRKLGVRSVAHEVGYQRFSVFFTDGEPTAYPIQIPEGFELTVDQNARLDAYLERRFQGKFSMAGIQFWPEMRGLDQEFLQRASQFRQVVPVFTNVIYDTSQIHANMIFPHMFAWLDLLLEIIRGHPETLFVIRAHPDEMRPGSAKQSRESVRDWARRNHIEALPNTVFIDSQEYVSSYELIQRAKFVMVYNSSIGLEAALMGKAVLCGGKARYTQYSIVIFPGDMAEFRRRAVELLEAETVSVPPEYQANARRFLYYQLYRASLPLDGYLQAARRMGFVQLRPFDWKNLLPENSPALRVIVEGILHGKPFLMPEN